MRAAVAIASLTGILILIGIGFTVAKNSPKNSSSPQPPPTKLAASASPSPCPNFHEGEITVGDKELQVSIAATHEEKVHGLSGCDALPENSGMLFPYTPAQPAAFWMKDMLMPLDIVWIYQSKVIGIEKNVPAPAPGTASKNLPQYKSPGPIDTVLEIKSGGAGEYGIQVGSGVNQ